MKNKLSLNQHTKPFIAVFKLFFKNVRKTFSDETVTVFATQLVKAATDRQEYVILDAFLDGEENFVTKVVHLFILDVLFWYMYMII